MSHCCLLTPCINLQLLELNYSAHLRAAITLSKVLLGFFHPPPAVRCHWEGLGAPLMAFTVLASSRIPCRRGDKPFCLQHAGKPSGSSLQMGVKYLIQSHSNPSQPVQSHLLLSSITPCALCCRLLMEKRANDSRDRGHHRWNISNCHFTLYHRCPLLL